MRDTMKKNADHLDDRSIYPTISRDVVKYLRARHGMTLREIGALMGLSESFISRVQKSQRSLTLLHLSKLEKALQIPLPLILLEATEIDVTPTELREAYVAFRSLMANFGKVFSVRPRSSARKKRTLEIA